MGVNLYLLDRRKAVLLIGGSKQTVGTLRRFFKLTELDADRAAERATADRIRPSPVAALIVDVSELPLATDPEKPVPVHQVLGWDEGRGSVTDFEWDYLPTLGFAVRDSATDTYTLHEERNGLLHAIDENRARELRLIDSGGSMTRQGQPHIAECRSIKRYISGYVEADCTLEDGRQEKLLIAVSIGPDDHRRRRSAGDHAARRPPDSDDLLRRYLQQRSEIRFRKDRFGMEDHGGGQCQ